VPAGAAARFLSLGSYSRVFSVITEKSVSRSAGHPTRTAKPNRRADSDRKDRFDPQRDLSVLAAEIRIDSCDDPVFYLVRSNTSYDGE